MANQHSQVSNSIQGNALKQAFRAFLTAKYVNRVVVWMLSSLPPFHWKQRIPVVGREGLLDLGDGDVVRMGHTDKCQIALELFWNQGSLESPADRLALNIAVTCAKEAVVFLDIGAYSGVFALAAGRVNSKIKSYAYEILPENFLTLYSNIFRNNMLARVEPRLCGLADKAGAITLPTSFATGVLPSSISLGWEFDEGIEVPLKTLDELHPDVEGPVVIKIDVEGFETEVFEGGQRLLERTRPDIVCEVLRRAPRISDMEALMRPLGYRFYHITNSGLVEHEHIKPKKLERDWFFTVRDADEIRSMGFSIVDGI